MRINCTCPFCNGQNNINVAFFFLKKNLSTNKNRIQFCFYSMEKMSGPVYKKQVLMNKGEKLPLRNSSLHNSHYCYVVDQRRDEVDNIMPYLHQILKKMFN